MLTSLVQAVFLLLMLFATTPLRASCISALSLVPEAMPTSARVLNFENLWSRNEYYAEFARLMGLRELAQLKFLQHYQSLERAADFYRQGKLLEALAALQDVEYLAEIGIRVQ